MFTKTATAQPFLQGHANPTPDCKRVGTQEGRFKSRAGHVRSVLDKVDGVGFYSSTSISLCQLPFPHPSSKAGIMSQIVA
jgi:hypothetical protein